MVNYFKYLIVFIILTISSYVLFIQFTETILCWFISVILSVLLIIFFLKQKIDTLNIAKLILVSAFLFVITIPFIGEKETESLEKRTLAEFPQWEWNNVWKFFKAYPTYFNDHFAFRNNVIEMYGKVKYEKIGFKPVANMAISGKNEFLFYKGEDYFKHLSTPYTQDELKHFHYNLVVTTKWFKQHGIKYYLTIPPVKGRIYYEYLPEYLKIKLKFSRLAQLKNYLTKKSTINFIGYTDELINQKSKRRLYYSRDTHWNEYGAFIAYKKIMKIITKDFLEIIPEKLVDYEHTELKMYNGDLQGLLGYKNNIYSKRVVLHRKDSISPIISDSSLINTTGNKFEVWKSNSCNNNLRLLVFRDSFTENLKKFLSASFSYSSYVWDVDLSIKKINEEKPDIILHEMLERYTFHYLTLPQEIKDDTLFLKQFDIADF